MARERAIQIVLNERLSLHISFMKVLPTGKLGREAPSRNTDPKTTTKRLLLEPNMGLLPHVKPNSDYKYLISGKGSQLMVLFLRVYFFSIYFVWNSLVKWKEILSIIIFSRFKITSSFRNALYLKKKNKTLWIVTVYFRPKLLSKWNLLWQTFRDQK